MPLSSISAMRLRWNIASWFWKIAVGRPMAWTRTTVWGTATASTPMSAGQYSRTRAIRRPTRGRGSARPASARRGSVASAPASDSSGMPGAPASRSAPRLHHRSAAGATPSAQVPRSRATAVPSVHGRPRKGRRIVAAVITTMLSPGPPARAVEPLAPRDRRSSVPGTTSTRRSRLERAMAAVHSITVDRLSQGSPHPVTRAPGDLFVMFSISAPRNTPAITPGSCTSSAGGGLDHWWDSAGKVGPTGGPGHEDVQPGPGGRAGLDCYWQAVIRHRA